MRQLLTMVGEDPGREGLLDTPTRYVKALKEMTSGYEQDPADILKVFSDGGENYDQMVIIKDIPVYSLCEHHMAPFWGVAHIAYIPNGKIVGLSKLARLVNIYARRLQVQERLTQQVAQALQDNLNPRGVGVILRCRHMCMESRGIRTTGSETVTSSLFGEIFEHTKSRAEFLGLAANSM